MDREYQMIHRVGNYEILYHKSVRACGERPGDVDPFFMKKMPESLVVFRKPSIRRAIRKTM